MELQVMILDDEYIILDGLCSFPWSDYCLLYTSPSTASLKESISISAFSVKVTPFLDSQRSLISLSLERLM